MAGPSARAMSVCRQGFSGSGGRDLHRLSIPRQPLLQESGDGFVLIGCLGFGDKSLCSLASTQTDPFRWLARPFWDVANYMGPILLACCWVLVGN